MGFELAPPRVLEAAAQAGKLGNWETDVVFHGYMKLIN